MRRRFFVLLLKLRRRRRRQWSRWRKFHATAGHRLGRSPFSLIAQERQIFCSVLVPDRVISLLFVDRSKLEICLAKRKPLAFPRLDYPANSRLGNAIIAVEKTTTAVQVSNAVFAKNGGTHLVPKSTSLSSPTITHGIARLALPPRLVADDRPQRPSRNH